MEQPTVMHFTNDLISEGKKIAAACIPSPDQREAREKGREFADRKLAELEELTTEQRRPFIQAWKNLVGCLALYTLHQNMGGLAADDREVAFFGMVVEVLESKEKSSSNISV